VQLILKFNIKILSVFIHELKTIYETKINLQRHYITASIGGLSRRNALTRHWSLPKLNKQAVWPGNFWIKPGKS
jgi:hypothetical protein